MAELKPERVKEISDAVLYEGHFLYPYRLSALKNRQRWTFGRLYPRAYGEAQRSVDAWFMQTECLVLGRPETRLGVRVRFLQLMEGMDVDGVPPNRAEVVPIHEDLFHSRQEPVEREVIIADLPFAELLSSPKLVSFAFPTSREGEPFLGSSCRADGQVVRRRWPLEGTLELSARCTGVACFKLTVRVSNLTRLHGADPTDRDAVLLRTLLSAHSILEVREGRFVSLLDPPEPLGPLAAGCHNVGTWPVLVGEEGERDMMLSAPMILYDYPRVAPESPGDFFDGTEVDELLTLRVLTLTDEEKREVRAMDGYARALLDRTERLTREQVLRLHGALRSEVPPALQPGARVRLRPRGRSDAMDLILSGKTATIICAEQDDEGRIHLAVTVDEDPGQDLGWEGQPGHRFYFRPEEVEPLAVEEEGPHEPPADPHRRGG
ncbi:MAG: hypothetical protein JO329_24345 [Planctomycetaceae bacterium]|nr:hypothetical protein [Planctomycetaceae bacterium]